MISDMTVVFPHLNIEVLEGGTLRLENESLGDHYSVDVHPIHVRYMAEQLGVFDAMLEPNRLRTLHHSEEILRLRRHLERVRSRALELQECLGTFRDREGGHLDAQIIRARSLVDLLETGLDLFLEGVANISTSEPASIASMNDGKSPGLAATPSTFKEQDQRVDSVDSFDLEHLGSDPSESETDALLPAQLGLLESGLDEAKWRPQ